MAADMELWFCSELGKLGIDATEDNARYILSMENSNDLEEYMTAFLDVSDPKVRVFLQELRIRCGHDPGHAATPYRKEFPEVNSTSGKSRKKTTKAVSNASVSNGERVSFPATADRRDGQILDSPSSEMKHVDSPKLSSSGELGVGAKKKSKYIPLFSSEGQAKSVIQLPGRHICECQAAKHRLINNCVCCGRVVCEQEGAGPCVFCGNLVCTREDQEILDRGTKRSEKLRNSLMRGGHLNRSSDQSVEKAVKHRDKLLEFDRNSVRRTQVIDDECDYYATDANQWLNQADREKLRMREEELRKARHGSRRDRKITLDFAGRKVLDAEDNSAKQMYSREDSVIQQVHYGMSDRQETSATTTLANPVYAETPQFISHSWGPKSRLGQQIPDGFDVHSSGNQRIQDRELQEMSDEGMCLSMHQPWASLLVEGIKMHEGRTWYSAHRGRLWIASTGKAAAPEEIAEMEHMYKVLYNDYSLQFPRDYPVGCLLGCVTVDDCLSQDEYREKYPDGESSSPYVFICSNPQQLLVKFPMKGKRKIYRLEPHLHKAAKKGLR
ncbi:thyroid hormone receptor interactor 4 [Plakobranchus ocellatus]|uniref:Thyroid hormone receptor interactor 4 n=1 Tax=Plakobranchus ocellatus TaxID=259542 RepID=A0AAV4CWG6_9GAST|nr:thyroid hormone receptor interactor 4 [Plakobranchus ocellatus]